MIVLLGESPFSIVHRFTRERSIEEMKKAPESLTTVTPQSIRSSFYLVPDYSISFFDYSICNSVVGIPNRSMYHISSTITLIYLSCTHLHNCTCIMMLININEQLRASGRRNSSPPPIFLSTSSKTTKVRYIRLYYCWRASWQPRMWAARARIIKAWFTERPFVGSSKWAMSHSAILPKLWSCSIYLLTLSLARS